MARSSPPVYPGCPATAEVALRTGRRLRPTRWSAWDALWAVLLALVIGNAVAVAVLASGGSLTGGWVLVAVAAPWLGLAGWPLLVTRWRGNGVVIDLGWRFRPGDWGWGLVGGVAAFAAGLLGGLVSLWLFGDFTSAAGEQAEELASTGGPVLVLLFALMVAVGAPIAEELAFRGLLFAGLAKRGVRPWLTVLVTAVAFSLLHFEPRRLLVLLGIGIVLGVVRWRTRSLGAAIVAHGVNNLPGALGILALAAGADAAA